MAKFKPGTSGNPKGRPKGVPNPQARIRQVIGDDMPRILAVLRDKALDGDVQAASLLLSRCLPALRPTSAAVELPGAGKTLAERAEAITAAAVAGELPPDAAADLMSVIAAHARVKEIAELEARISALEGKNGETS